MKYPQCVRSGFCCKQITCAAGVHFGSEGTGRKGNGKTCDFLRGPGGRVLPCADQVDAGVHGMKPKLKPEVKEKWLAALRDPSRYVQFRGGLRDHSFEGPQECLCCLGVLNDISRLGAWADDGDYVTPGVRDEWREEYERAKRDWPEEGEECWKDWADENGGPQFEEEEEGIHIKVAEWAFVDITANDVHIPYINAESIRDRLPEERVEDIDLSNQSIAILNDDLGATFEMLADLIEEQM